MWSEASKARPYSVPTSVPEQLYKKPASATEKLTARRRKGEELHKMQCITNHENVDLRVSARLRNARENHVRTSRCGAVVQVDAVQ